ncbi:MAG: DJ-1/PfpI family protein [Oscillospiraceae bacterium]|jgi:4-methyl-5(b-hydroxyethyl)-thiazole monophosphate biosynthesis|nr:DJ-1/PfpI family protein [Oscillospiraceae bacterium]
MIYVFLANGFEELEAIAPIDILKRAKLDVKTVGVSEEETVKSSFGLIVKTDIQIENISTENLKAIILPGGLPGTTNLYNNAKIHEVINHCVKNNILIGAICAAPTILGKAGLLKGKKACCYPGCEEELKGAILSQGDPVCTDGNIVTSKGPGTAIEFGFALLEYLKGNRATEIAKNSMQYSETILDRVSK